jgi:gluconate 2-dehydrogenase gamma chain
MTLKFNMEKGGVSRRRFIGGLSGAIGSAWLSSHWTGILAAQEHVHSVISQGSVPELQFFTALQAAQVEALTAQIIPTDDTPGAKEAGAVYFIDRALATFDKERGPVYIKGLKHLESVSRKFFPRSGTFSDLKPDQQIKVMRAIEKSEFFDVLRTQTVISFMADPEYGGNRGKAGWKLIGFEDVGAFKPPFGYYDRMHQSDEGAKQ